MFAVIHSTDLVVVALEVVLVSKTTSCCSARFTFPFYNQTNPQKMSLGIGGATPFSQPSNHQTAANHTIRDTSSYDHTKQTKVKCTSCGMWAQKGGDCKFCKHPAGKDWKDSPKSKVFVFFGFITPAHYPTPHITPGG